MNTDKLKELAMSATAEPWLSWPLVSYGSVIRGDETTSEDQIASVCTPKMARRIVACFNACRELDIEMLEAIPHGNQKIMPIYTSTMAQRDELLAALKAVVAVWDDIYPDMESGKYPQERLEHAEFTEMWQAKLAIAKAVQP